MKLWKFAIIVFSVALGFILLDLQLSGKMEAHYVAPIGKDDFHVQTITAALSHPWGMTFLPDGRLLVTERAGTLRTVNMKGTISPPLKGVPEVFANRQGGLLDVILDPQFATNHIIYLSYAEAEGDKGGTAVAKAVFSDTSLKDVKVIFRQKPKADGGGHFGSRLVFAPDGTLFITLGDRYEHPEQAQALDSHLGKTVRIHSDGTTPADNPFVNQKGALPEIWSYGHRNMQGSAIHPVTGEFWVHEHGPRGGDEINIARAGKNYGWPNACYGSHYSGIPIPDDHASRGYEEPIHHWTPSIAPSGMVFYTGLRFPAWQNSLLVGALNGMHLSRLQLDGNKVVSEERLLTKLGARIRDVEQGPDGNIYLLTDEDAGRILRITPLN